MNSYQKLDVRGTTRSETALIVGVITRAKVFEVVPGSYDVDQMGNERYLLKSGGLLQLADRAVLGYLLQEPVDPVATMWESKNEEKGNA